MHLRKYITLILLFSLWGNLWSQTCKIEVYSARDSVAIPFSHICIEQGDNKSYAATDENGTIKVPISKRAIISISSMGYDNLVDTFFLNSKGIKVYLQEKMYSTDAVVITGQFKATSRDKSIYSIKVIDSKTIEELAASNLGELLNHELNIKINNDPSTGSSMELHGISGENVKILVDGVPLIGRIDGNIDLSQINLDEVAQIEIVEGPMSVSYGSNALGGVINIITKENKYAQLAVGVRSYIESVGQYNFHGDIHKRFGNHAIHFNGGRKFFGGYSLNDSLRSQEWKPKEQYYAGGYYIYSNKNIKTKFKSDYFIESLLNKGNLLAPYYEKAFDTWFYTNRFNNSLSVIYQMDTIKSFNISASHSYYKRSSNKYIKDLTDLSSSLTDNIADHDTIAFNTFVLRTVFNRAHAKLKFDYQLGIDFTHEFGEGKRMLNGRDDMGDYALFASVQWKISNNFTFQPALRTSYNTKYSSPIAPSMNLKYIHKKSSYRFSYARGYRAPSLKELNLYFFDSNHQIEGNPDLKAEYSHNFNAFYAWQSELMKRPFKFNFKVYHTLIQDMIALVQVDPDNILHYRNENVGEFKNIGGETSILLYPIKKVKLHLGYSLIGNNDASFGTSNYVFGSLANAGINYSFYKNKCNLIIDYKYIGKSPYYVYIQDDLQINYSEAYHNLDINLNGRFHNNRLVLGVGAKNLFDNTSIATLNSGGGHSSAANSLVGWGRTYYVSLAYKFITY